MADSLRWRYGETNPIVLPVDSATVIEIGDLVYLDTDDVQPASSLADQRHRSRKTRKRSTTSSPAWPCSARARATPRRSAWPRAACSSSPALRPRSKSAH